MRRMKKEISLEDTKKLLSSERSAGEVGCQNQLFPI